MKLSRTTIILLAALTLGGAFGAHAQSNGVPGDLDYAKFSSFVTERNIFDPNRYPRNSRTTTRRTTTTRTRTRTVGAPFVALVGTMSYEKGLFAFFNSNNSDLKKILAVDDEIAGYTVKGITANAVTLIGPDKKEVLMKVGEQMHQEGNNWLLNSHNESAGGTTAESAPTAEAETTAEAAETPAAAAPSANLESNDVLKRLMQLREKENQ